MAEDSKIEREENIEDLDLSTPCGSRSSSFDRGSYLQPSFQDPTYIPGRLQWMEAVDLLAPIPRSDLRSSTELAEDSVPWTVAVTLAPKSGARIERLHDDSVFLDHRSTSAPTVAKDDLESPENRTRSAPSTWMTAITARVNTLWGALYGRPSVANPMTEMTEREFVEPIERPPPLHSSSLQVEAPSLDDGREPSMTGIPRRGLWHLDSDIAIDLDRTHAKRTPSPELDLRILVVIALEFAETDHHRVMIATVVTIPMIIDVGDLGEETVHTEEAIPRRVMIVTARITIVRQQETSRYVPSSFVLNYRSLMALDPGSPGGLISRTVLLTTNGTSAISWHS